MGIHPSLKGTDSLAATRSVMKRIERIKWMMAKGMWTDEKNVRNLPKIKVLKIKSGKKEKVAKDAAAPAAGAAAPAAGAKPIAAAKPAAGAKPAAAPTAAAKPAAKK